MSALWLLLLVPAAILALSLIVSTVIWLALVAAYGQDGPLG